MLSWTIEEKKLDLLYNWKLSRNETFHKINFFIHVTDGQHTGIGEVAPNIRYQETSEVVLAQFNDFLGAHPSDFPDIVSFSRQLDNFKLCNALRFGIESAFVHLLSQKLKTPTYELLGLSKPLNIKTCYTIPIMGITEIAQFISKNNLKRFDSLKIKVNQDSALEMLEEVSKHYSGPLMVDANEAWQDVESVLRWMEKIKKYTIAFVEQPLPYNFNEEYIYLKKSSPFILMGDESITNNGDFTILQKQFHGINIKLMKAGGYLNGIHLLQQAKQQGLKTMIGCMVETTLGIFSALNLCGMVDYADLDGYMIIANEPFKLVYEENGKVFFNEKKETFI